MIGAFVFYVWLLLQENEKTTTLTPYSGFKIEVTIDFDHPQITNTESHIEIDFSTTSFIASSQLHLTSLLFFLIYGVSSLYFKRPSQEYLVLSDIHSSLISLFNLGKILFTSQP